MHVPVTSARSHRGPSRSQPLPMVCCRRHGARQNQRLPPSLRTRVQDPDSGCGISEEAAAPAVPCRVPGGGRAPPPDPTQRPALRVQGHTSVDTEQSGRLWSIRVSAAMRTRCFSLNPEGLWGSGVCHSRHRTPSAITRDEARVARLRHSSLVREEACPSVRRPVREEGRSLGAAAGAAGEHAPAWPPPSRRVTGKTGLFLGGRQPQAGARSGDAAGVWGGTGREELLVRGRGRGRGRACRTLTRSTRCLQRRSAGPGRADWLSITGSSGMGTALGEPK